MTRTRYPLRDVQQDPVVAYCSNPFCKAELYGEDEIMPGGLCPECYERMEDENSD